MSEQQAGTSETPPAKRYRFQQEKSVEGLYLTTRCADVYFSIQANAGTVRTVTRVPAHKTLLAVDSDVFERMFFGESIEIGDRRVTDASDAAFKEFLQFFYLSEVKLSDEHIASVLQLGYKYNVKACVKACAKFLKDDLNDGNVCTALECAILSDQEELMKICEQRIILNTAAVFQSVGFLKCNKRAVEHILKMNVLSCTEVEVFEACMAWVRAKSKRKILTTDLIETYLGKSFYQFRFVSMTMKEFCGLSSKYNHVLSNAFEAITNIIVQPELKSSIFNTFPRKPEWNAEAIVKCDRVLNKTQSPFMLHATVRTTFTSNQPLIFGEFTCGMIGVVHKLPVRNLRADLPVNVEISEASSLNGANSKNLLKMPTKLQSKESNVLLTHPVLIRPGFYYTISIDHFPDDHCYYAKELRIEVQPESDLKIKFNTCEIGHGKTVGLISVLNFNRLF